MELKFPELPTSYIKGIEAYKSGEWEGKYPCKFRQTKRIIQPIDHGIFIGCREK